MDTKNKNVFIFSQEKKKYKSVAHAVMKIADESNTLDIGFLTKRMQNTYNNAIVYCNKINDINIDVNKNIKAKKVAWWMGDYLESPSKNFIDKKITHIFHTCRSLISKYGKKYKVPVYYMPLCGLDDREIKYRNINWNILFIGGIHNTPVHRERGQWFEEIKKFNFKLIDNEGHTIDKKYLYKNTPINISFSRYTDGTTSGRLFDILASGGFVLVRYFPGLEELFENHRDLVWFTNKDEMKKLVEYYLNHFDERKEIARQGYETYMKKHTAEHRIKNILDIMDGKTDEFYGYRD